MKLLISVSALRNFLLGLTLLLTGKLFLAPVFSGAFGDFLAIVLLVSSLIVAVCVDTRVRLPYHSLMPIGLLIGDVVLIYFFVNRLFEATQGLYGLPILFGALIVQDFGLIFYAAREEPRRALHWGREQTPDAQTRGSSDG